MDHRSWFGHDPDVPRAVHAEIPRVAAAQAARTGWAKVIAAGVDSLEHGMCLDPDLRGLDHPTAVVLRGVLVRGAPRGTPDLREDHG